MIPNPKESNPTEANKALKNDFSSYRKIYCSKYNDCLDHALALRWKGFTCNECCVDNPISRDQFKSDIISLLELAKEVLNPETDGNSNGEQD